MIPTFGPTLVATATAVLAAGACGTGEGESAAGTPVVVATTTIWADVVSNVACEGEFDVQTLIPAGTDPHSYEPSLRDRETLDGAALIVANGLGLEETLTDTLDAAADDATPVFAVGDHLDTIPYGGGTDADPHVWFDPIRVAAVLPALGEALVTAGADDRQIARCVEAYAAELTELDAQIRDMVRSIPEPARVLVTNHDSLGYFADRYGFEVLGTVIPSGGTLTEASLAELDELAEVIEAERVPAIFAEDLGSTDDASALGDRLGVDVATLFTDALGEPGSGADTYVGLLRTDAQLVRDALAA